jgi:hypothetical protein
MCWRKRLLGEEAERSGAPTTAHHVLLRLGGVTRDEYLLILVWLYPGEHTRHSEPIFEQEWIRCAQWQERASH